MSVHAFGIPTCTGKLKYGVYCDHVCVVLDAPASAVDQAFVHDLINQLFTNEPHERVYDFALVHGSGDTHDVDEPRHGIDYSTSEHLVDFELPCDEPAALGTAGSFADGVGTSGSGAAPGQTPAYPGKEDSPGT